METYRGYTIEETNNQWLVYGKGRRILFTGNTADECMNEIDRQKRADFVAAWGDAQTSGLWRYAARQKGQSV